MDKIAELKARLVELQNDAADVQLRADNDKRDLTTDEHAELARLFDEFDTVQADLNARIRLADQAARLEAGTGRRSAPDLDNPEAPTHPSASIQDIRTPYSDKGKWGWRSLGEQAAAIRAAVRNPAQADPRLYNAPTTNANEGAGADGGYAVAPDFRDRIMTKVLGEDSLLTRTDQMTTSSNTMTFPRDETTPWGTSGITATWEGEAQQHGQKKPVLKDTTIRLNKLVTLVPVTDELLDDAPAMSSYLNAKVPTVFDSAINLAIVQGNGVGKPLGILAGGDLVSVAKESGQAADTIVHENIVNMYSRLYAPSRRNAVWLINQDIEPQLNTMAFKNTAAAGPIYMPPGGLAAAPYATLMGRPVIPVEAANTLGDQGDIIFTDLSQYLTIMKTAGIQSTVSIHLWFDYDVTAFKFIWRLAGQPHYSGTIAKRSGSNTLAHNVTLDARA